MMNAPEVPFKPAEEGVSEPQSFNPLPIPPRGEITAWVFTLMLAGLSAILYFRMGSLPFWAPLFTALTFLLALSIRFSRWLEAHTSILLSPTGVGFMSPIRQHRFEWAQIDQISAYKAGNGWRVLVQAEGGSFRFQTATTLRGMRGVELRTGYPHGKEIVGQILRHVRSQEPKYEGRSWVWRTK